MVRATFYALIMVLHAQVGLGSTSVMDINSFKNELPGRIEFTVKDLASDEIRFVGDELISVDGEVITKVTTYRAPSSGKAGAESVAQKETVVYDGKTLTTLSYELKNFITGENANLKLILATKANESSASALYEMGYVSKEGEPAVVGKVINGERLRTGKVLHHVIVRSWSQLREGKPTDFDLLVPFKLDKFHFQFAKVAEQENLVTLRLEPAAWLIRKFVQPMDFIYEHDNHKNQRLVRYVGPTTIDAYRNPDWKVKIEFRY